MRGDEREQDEAVVRRGRELPSYAESASARHIDMSFAFRLLCCATASGLESVQHTLIISKIACQHTNEFREDSGGAFLSPRLTWTRSADAP